MSCLTDFIHLGNKIPKYICSEKKFHLGLIICMSAFLKVGSPVVWAEEYASFDISHAHKIGLNALLNIIFALRKYILKK